MCEYAASMPCEFARIGAHYVLTIQSVIAWDPISAQMKCKMFNFAQGREGIVSRQAIPMRVANEAV